MKPITPPLNDPTYVGIDGKCANYCVLRSVEGGILLPQFATGCCYNLVKSARSNLCI
jgi:hypothetical protein